MSLTARPTFSIQLASLLIFIAIFSQVDAGFWTFYFPNFLKPSGYNELSGMIRTVELEMNKTIDNFEDVKYFWGLMQNLEMNDASFYPEESVCADIFPTFRDLAIEYSRIDYEHFINPIQEYHQYLLNARSEFFPEGAKSKNVLPRQWEQSMHERELELRMESHRELTKKEEFVERRVQLVKMWKSVKRSLDASVECLYLRFAYRQIAEDINQQALDWNLESMEKAMEMLLSAYKRIDKFRASDEKAVEKIAASVESHQRFELNE